MHSKGPQSQLFDFVGDEGTVHTPAHSDHAIKFLPRAVFLDLSHDFFEPSSSFLTGEYAAFHPLVINMTMVAHSVLVELDFRI